ncbi:MAG TPA: amidohydrolase [Opitutaceae bacterium]
MVRSTSSISTCAGRNADEAAPFGRLTAIRAVALAALSLGFAPAGRAAPDDIFYNGKVVTVDSAFSVAQAFAVEGGRLVAVGGDAQVRAAAGPRTRSHDLKGGFVLPGLIDSHTHPTMAALSEFDHVTPIMESVPEVLAFIRSRSQVVPAGDWIVVEQVFITRLKEQRFPTKAELDKAAPGHPVCFSTGSDMMLNSLALKRCGMDRSFVVEGAGVLERGAAGEPTGLLRGLGRYVHIPPTGRIPTEEDIHRRLKELFHAYNAAGLTAVADRKTDYGIDARYQAMLEHGDLTVRLSLSQLVPDLGPISSSVSAVDELAKSPLRKGTPWLHLVGIKMFADGGMMSGSSYMSRPWGRSGIYAITDGRYRGVLNTPAERFYRIGLEVAKQGLQFDTHAVGDAAIETMLDVYERVDREFPIGKLRWGLSHADFMRPDLAARAARLGVVADIQPIRFYDDIHTLVRQFDAARMAYFHPLQSLFQAGVTVGGGSDHMQKVDEARSINSYNPFLGMWTTISREGKDYRGRLCPEQALSRRQAIEFYTRNNAYLLFWENEIGSLEVGKRADFILVDRDLLTCPVDEIKAAGVRETWVDGRRVYPEHA